MTVKVIKCTFSISSAYLWLLVDVNVAVMWKYFPSVYPSWRRTAIAHRRYINNTDSSRYCLIYPLIISIKTIPRHAVPSSNLGKAPNQKTQSVLTIVGQRVIEKS